MTVDFEQERRRAHDYLDRLPATQLRAVSSLLEAMLEPTSQAGGDDRRRFREGQAWFAERGGKGVPMEEVLAEFGLTTEDFPLEK